MRDFSGPAFLRLNNKRITYEEIANHQGDFKVKDSFEQATLNFARDWLNGQNTFVIHTSGSTGSPKPIQITRSQMIASAQMTASALNLTTGNTSLICLNTEYIAGMMMLVRGFEMGLQMIVVSPSSNPFEHLTHDTKIDFTALVPLQLQTVLSGSDNASKLNELKAIIVGGAPINYGLQKQITKVKAPIYATYGMTETVSHIALKRLNGPEASNRYTAFEEVQLSQDHRGCLTIQSVLTNNEKVVTNDLVELMNSHEFKWLGRADHVINTGGIKVSSDLLESKIEEIFYEQKLNRRSFISKLDDERLGQKIILVIEGGRLSEAVENGLKDALRDRLQKYECPKAMYFVPKFHETNTGKVLRSGYDFDLLGKQTI
ncbi:AMP-binding protein [Fulvivirgaceae bacterium BMA10]|uniref:AMP-binding protein n=1 Tax=Splendidivirga corallicola TaxID=3051826 RepID=A0ABT8KR46_9BACT|nr:AMP-binding protein [Fulvivirgaceae bacterium BMA10]